MTTNPTKICFVIGPIGDADSERRVHADWLLTGIIEPVFKDHFQGFTVERADTIPTPGMVSSQIINRLYEAELVIADLSFHNANAFYEMAIRHNVGKPIIHMIRKGETIPFDVIPHRAIPFSNARPADHLAARTLLRPAIAAAIAEGFEPDNPIKHARGKLQLQENASPEIKVLTNEVAAIRDLMLAMQGTLGQPKRPQGASTTVADFEWAIEKVRTLNPGLSPEDEMRVAWGFLVATKGGQVQPE